MLILSRKPQPNVTLSAELEELIREAIHSGKLKPGQRLGSAKQLAKHWKTSYGAVRQSLETLAAKGLVERRARAGTFVSSSSELVGTGIGAKNVIGLLVPDIRVPEYSLITRCVQDAGHQAGLEVIVSSTDNDRARYDQSILRHLQAGVGGLILASPHHAKVSLQTLLEIEKSGTPAVNYARPIDVVRWPTVQTDLFQAVYLLVRHLCDLGRKRIAFFTYGAPDIHFTQMHYGLYRAIADSGLNGSNIVEFLIPDDFYLNGWTDTNSLALAIIDWLDQHPKIDAICCMHDHIATVVLGVLRQRSVRVPDDIAVTGCGHIAEYFGLQSGTLTTVDTHVDKAAAEMIRILQSPADPKRENQPSIITIPPELVTGSSTLSNGGPIAPKHGA
jgi:LacI family transcriptional regulator